MYTRIYSSSRSLAKTKLVSRISARMANLEVAKLQKELAATKKSLAALTADHSKKRKRNATEVVKTVSEGVSGTFKKVCAKGRFGFAEIENGIENGKEIFVIPSACTDNVLPKVGEKITFSVVVGEDGKQRAEGVKKATQDCEEIGSSEGEQATEDPYEEEIKAATSSSSGQPCPPPIPVWPWTQTKAERTAELLHMTMAEMHRIYDTMELVDDEFRKWLNGIRAERAQQVSQGESE